MNAQAGYPFPPYGVLLREEGRPNEGPFAMHGVVLEAAIIAAAIWPSQRPLVADAPSEQSAFKYTTCNPAFRS